MTKKLIIIISSIAAAILIFVGGFYCGLKFFSWTFNVTKLQKAYVELIPLQSDIEALDRKDYDALSASINLRLDSELITIYNLIGESNDKEQIHKAKKWVARVATHRKKFPAAYPKFPDDDRSEAVRGHIDAILAEYIDYK